MVVQPPPKCPNCNVYSQYEKQGNDSFFGFEYGIFRCPKCKHEVESPPQLPFLMQ